MFTVTAKKADALVVHTTPSWNEALRYSNQFIFAHSPRVSSIIITRSDESTVCFWDGSWVYLARGGQMNKPMADAMAQIFNGLNAMGSKKGIKETIVDAFRTTHRTLQQQFMGTVIVPILIHLADQYAAGNCDGRNMASGRLASRMLENLNDDDLYLPFI